MSFKRNIYTTINFKESTITDSDEYKDFTEKNPELIDVIDNIIYKFIKWAQNQPCKRDLCYSSKTSQLIDDCWGVDEDEGSWEEFDEQMGTTSEKFSLSDVSDLPNETLRLIGQVFEEVGFTVFVIRFIPWRLGYDYTLTKLKDFKGKISDDNRKEAITINICISV